MPDILIKKQPNFPEGAEHSIKFQKEDDACFDLVCAVYPYIEINHNQVSKVYTGISMEIPKGYELQIRPRSGLALKYGITIVNSPGTIDSGYRGEIIVPMIKMTSGTYKIFPGDRIAQAKLSIVPNTKIIFVNELSESERGSDGFGSTGV